MALVREIAFMVVFSLAASAVVQSTEEAAREIEGMLQVITHSSRSTTRTVGRNGWDR
jgi:hypothetical protein